MLRRTFSSLARKTRSKSRGTRTSKSSASVAPETIVAENTSANDEDSLVYMNIPVNDNKSVRVLVRVQPYSLPSSSWTPEK